MNLDELLRTETAVEAFDPAGSGTYLVVSDSSMGANLFDLTLRHDEAMPPFRSYTGERMIDIKAIIRAEGFELDSLTFYPIEEE